MAARRIVVGAVVQRPFVEVDREFYSGAMGVALEDVDPDIVLGTVLALLPDGSVRVRFDALGVDTVLEPDAVDVVDVPRWMRILEVAPLAVGDVVFQLWKRVGEATARYHLGELWNADVRMCGKVVALEKRSAFVRWALPPTDTKHAKKETEKLGQAKLRKMRLCVDDPSNPALVARAVRIEKGKTIPRPPGTDPNYTPSLAVVARMKAVEVDAVARALSSGGKAVAHRVLIIFFDGVACRTVGKTDRPHRHRFLPQARLEPVDRRGRATRARRPPLQAALAETALERRAARKVQHPGEMHHGGGRNPPASRAPSARRTSSTAPPAPRRSTRIATTSINSRRTTRRPAST